MPQKSDANRRTERGKKNNRANISYFSSSIKELNCRSDSTNTFTLHNDTDLTTLSDHFLVPATCL